MADDSRGRKDHKKGLFKLFSRSGGAGSSGAKKDGGGKEQRDDDDLTLPPSYHPNHHHDDAAAHEHQLGFSLHSPLGSSAPVFSSWRPGGGGRGILGGAGGGGGGNAYGGGSPTHGTAALAAATAAAAAEAPLPLIHPRAAEALKIAMDYLESSALEEEGLYRVSGNKLEVDRLKTLLEAGLLPSAETLKAHYADNHVIAGAIKKVLQEHEPLLSYDLYKDFMVVGGMTEEEEGDEEEEEEEEAAGGKAKAKETHYRALVQRLPPVSRDLLGHVLRHLQQVMEKSEENRMTVENLAATIGVNLLRKSESVQGEIFR